MATPVRQTILDAVGTALTGITVANAYKTTVVTVERLIKDWGSVPASLRPWVGYMPQVSTYSLEAFDSMVITMPVLVYAHIATTTLALRDEAINDLHDDILHAMMVDPTFSHYAIDCRIVDDQADIGDPDTTSREGVSGTLAMTFHVIYERTTALS